MPAGAGPKVDDIGFLVRKALLGVILGHALNSLIYRFSDTAFQAHFRTERASFWRLIRLCENTSGAPTVFRQNGGANAPSATSDMSVDHNGVIYLRF